MDKYLILNEIKNHLGFKKDSDFANFLGIKQNTLSTWKSRNVIDYDLIIAKCDGIDANWLLTGKGSMLKENSEALGEKESDSHLEKINWIIYDVKGSYSSEKHSETSLMRIALRIDQICINENISIDDLANSLNIKPVTLYEYVAANFPIPFSIIERIEQLYPHINKKWLYTGVGDYYNNEALILKAHLKEKEEKEILYKENKVLLQEKVAKLEADIEMLKSESKNLKSVVYQDMVSVPDNVEALEETLERLSNERDNRIKSLKNIILTEKDIKNEVNTPSVSDTTQQQNLPRL